MIVTRSSERGVAIVRPSGRLGLGPSLDLLRDTFGDLLDDPEIRSIVLELSDVTFVDSATLGEMVAAYRRAGWEGGRLVVAGASGKVQDLLSLTRMDELIEVFEDLDAAVASAASPGEEGRETP